MKNLLFVLVSLLFIASCLTFEGDIHEDSKQQPI